jgi:hypothetical protein
VLVEGSEGMTIDSCTFERVDGTAVMLAAYNRDATLRRNEFFSIGENGEIDALRTDRPLRYPLTSSLSSLLPAHILSILSHMDAVLHMLSRALFIM